MTWFLAVIVIVTVSAAVLDVRLWRRPEPPAVAKALLTPDCPSLPQAYAGDRLLSARDCSDEELLRRLSLIADRFDPAPDPRLYEMYLLPEEKR